MAKSKSRRTVIQTARYHRGVPRAAKASIDERVERFIAEMLEPKVENNLKGDPVDPVPYRICAQWRGATLIISSLVFFPETAYTRTWDFARLKYLEPDRFDLSLHRPSGHWFGAAIGVSLEDSLVRIDGWDFGELYEPDSQS